MNFNALRPATISAMIMAVRAELDDRVREYMKDGPSADGESETFRAMAELAKLIEDMQRAL